MIVIIIILFGVNIVFGLLWKQGLLPLLGIALVIAVGFGIYLGDWSNIRSASYVWQNAIFFVVTIGGYFSLFVVPTVVGTVLGHLLRNSFRPK